MTQTLWSERISGVIAGELRRYREFRGMSAQQLADACTEEGMPIQRSVIANFENGRRSSISVAELLVFAHVLGIPPVSLICPAGYEGETEILPSRKVNSYQAAEWVSGNEDLEEERECGDDGTQVYYSVPICAYRQFMEEFNPAEHENDVIVEMEDEGKKKGIDLRAADARYSVALHAHNLARAALAEAQAVAAATSREDDQARVEDAQARAAKALEELHAATLEHHRALELERKLAVHLSTLQEYQQRGWDILRSIENAGLIAPPIPPGWEEIYSRPEKITRPMLRWLTLADSQDSGADENGSASDA